MKKRELRAFSLAELLISLLVISIVMAAAMPVITRKTAQSSDQIWKWTDDNKSAWFGTGSGQSVLIGASSIPSGGGKNDKLHIVKPYEETNPLSTSHISFYNKTQEDGAELTNRIVSDTTNLAMGIGALASLNPANQTVRNSVLTSDKGKYNTAIGREALANTSVARANTAIGYRSLYNASGDGDIPIYDDDGNITGYNPATSFNTAVGVFSLENIAKGTDNIAIGYQAMQNASGSDSDGTNVSQNVAIGSQTLQNLQNGDYNIAIGRASMQSMQVGHHNISLGESNLNALNNTDSRRNIAMGFGILNGLVHGHENVGMGYQVLANLGKDDTTEYSSNIGMGFYTLTDLKKGNNNFAAGSQAAKNLIEGSGNVAIGEVTLAGYNYDDTTGTVGTAEGNYNTAIGSWAMGNFVSGDYNTAIGRYALASLQEGDSNTAIGHKALNSLQEGDSNTALGLSSLSSLTKGDENSALGQNSMKALTGGIGNIGIGSNTLRDLAQTGGNTVLGVGALIGFNGDDSASDSGAVYGGSRQSYSVRYNTALGYNAMRRMTTGIDNIAIGLEAMELADKTSWNIALGSRALRYSNNGSTAGNNIAIGKESMYHVISGTNNVAVGIDSLQNVSSNVIDNVAIGNGALKGGCNIENDEDGNVITDKASDIKCSSVSGALKYNTGIGKNVLYSLVSGNNNTVVGYNSGSNLVYGSANTVFGADALSSASSSDSAAASGVSGDRHNVAIGYAAMQYAKGGTNDVAGSTAVGWNALSHATAGAFHDLALGYQAGGCYDNNGGQCYTGGTHNTFIGAYSTIINGYGEHNVLINSKLTGDNYYQLRIGADAQKGADLIEGNLGGDGATQSLGKRSLTFRTPSGTTIEGYLTVTGTINGTTVGSSDARLKNITGDNTAGLKEIIALEVKNFTFKNDEKKTPRVGVIAQQLQKVFPNAVMEDKDGYLLIRQEDIFYAMVNSIKELFNKVQDLTAKVCGLDKRITELETQNKQLEKKNKELEERLLKVEKVLGN